MPTPIERAREIVKKCYHSAPMVQPPYKPGACASCIAEHLPKDNEVIVPRAYLSSAYSPPPSEDCEREARRLLWLKHGHMSILYGDDGEMQCSACPGDYKRQPISELIVLAFKSYGAEQRKKALREAAKIAESKSLCTHHDHTCNRVKCTCIHNGNVTKLADEFRRMAEEV